jgi:hypothetical protein
MHETATDSLPSQRPGSGVLRFLGFVLVAIGIAFTVFGLFCLVVRRGPAWAIGYVWTPFLGLPLIVLGSLCTQWRRLDAYDRDSSGQMVPRAPRGVATPGERGQNDGVVNCPGCYSANPATGKFCGQCGLTLRTNSCQACGAAAASDARFCVQCGKWLE